MFLVYSQYLASAAIDPQKGVNLRGGTNLEERLN